MAARPKLKVVRKGGEFRTLANMHVQPIRSTPRLVWTLGDIFTARDQQVVGRFALPARLAEGMRTDDALFVAYKNRLAPIQNIEVRIEPANQGARAKQIAREADFMFGAEGIALRKESLLDICGCLANHGVAFAVIDQIPRLDGSRVDFFLRYWPIDYVYWDYARRGFYCPTADGDLERIEHGDGRWVVFRKHEHNPWLQDAAILPASAVWGRHAYANRDWARGSMAHGSAKIIGELPEGVPLQTEDGNLSPEADAFLTLLRDIASAESPVGIRPSGAKTDFVVNTSTAWNVWSELVTSAEKAAARIYLGTDGILGSQGGAPGVDIESLFGVANTIVQGDIEAITRGIREGLIEPWCAVNFGDTKLAPSRKYVIEDGDADAFIEAAHKRRTYFLEAVEAIKGGGFALNQETVDSLAVEYGVPSLTLPPTQVRAKGIELAPTDAATVITVNEARASMNLPPLGGPDGEMTMSAYAAKQEQGSAPPSPPSPPSPPIPDPSQT